MVTILEKLQKVYRPGAVPENIGHGDMPGDKIHIGNDHIKKAGILFPRLLQLLRDVAGSHPFQRAVISVYGGSGVGKSEIASVLAFYLGQIGVSSYILSGDNYPRRIPRDNDLERLRVFRNGGLRGLVDSGIYQPWMAEKLEGLWAADLDASPASAREASFLQVYQQEGRRALAHYLGTEKEIDFNEVNAIIAQFKQGAETLYLKRMGRETSQLWYDPVDFGGISVLIIEWTHGNSDFLAGIDIPIMLNSTPAETLAHRQARSRDGNVDSPFTAMVLEIEQKKLEGQASRAQIILSKAGEMMDYARFLQQIAASREAASES